MRPDIARFLLSFFGLGYAPYGAGATASLVSITLLYLFRPYVADDIRIRLMFVTVTLLVIFIVFAASIQVLPEEGVSDPSWVVLDEVAAMVVLAVPLYLGVYEGWPFIVSIALFGFLDSQKPLFIGKIDALHSPASIMIDDIVAAVCSVVVCLAAHLLYSHAII